MRIQSKTKKLLETDLREVLNDMPTVFSSNEFAVRLRQKGWSEGEIALLQVRFLHLTCQQVGSRRTWSKREAIKAEKIIIKKIKDTNQSEKKLGLIRRFIKWIY